MSDLSNRPAKQVDSGWVAVLSSPLLGSAAIDPHLLPVSDHAEGQLCIVPRCVAEEHRDSLRASPSTDPVLAGSCTHPDLPRQHCSCKRRGRPGKQMETAKQTAHATQHGS